MLSINKSCILLWGILCLNQSLFGSDTLRIDLNEAEALFIKNNYVLLAQSMEIDIHKALEIQAKLLPNPVVSLDLNMYDPQNQKFFHTGKTGQKALQVEQLLRMGGKRQSEIQLAKTQTAIAELVFHDLIRTLKFELHQTFLSLSEQNHLIQQYGKRLEVLDSIIYAYETQVKKGNVPLKDLVRLRSLYINISNERLEVQKDNFEKMSTLRVLLQTQSYIIPEVPERLLSSIGQVFTAEELLQIALETRPDYQVATQNKALADQYISYQKKLSIPDLSVFASYDQRGGAFVHQINAGLAMSLPFFHRNQGGRKAAVLQSQVASLQQNALRLSIESEITSSLETYNECLLQYNKILGLYSKDFEYTFNSISSNFQKRNITMLEFVDFFEAYNSASHEIAKTKLHMWIAMSRLNYNVSKNLFE